MGSSEPDKVRMAVAPSGASETMQPAWASVSTMDQRNQKFILNYQDTHVVEPIHARDTFVLFQVCSSARSRERERIFWPLATAMPCAEAVDGA